MGSMLDRLRNHGKRIRRRAETANEPAAVAGKETFGLECFPDTRLARFVGGKLKEHKLREVQVHLVHCEDCAKRVEEIRKRRNA